MQVLYSYEENYHYYSIYYLYSVAGANPARVTGVIYRSTGILMSQSLSIPLNKGQYSKLFTVYLE